MSSKKTIEAVHTQEDLDAAVTAGVGGALDAVASFARGLEMDTQVKLLALVETLRAPNG